MLKCNVSQKAKLTKSNSGSYLQENCHFNLIQFVRILEVYLVFTHIKLIIKTALPLSRIYPNIDEADPLSSHTEMIILGSNLLVSDCSMQKMKFKHLVGTIKGYPKSFITKGNFFARHPWLVNLKRQMKHLCANRPFVISQ